MSRSRAKQELAEQASVLILKKPPQLPKPFQHTNSSDHASVNMIYGFDEPSSRAEAARPLVMQKFHKKQALTFSGSGAVEDIQKRMMLESALRNKTAQSPR
jgi:hypothetical protein